MVRETQNPQFKKLVRQRYVERFNSGFKGLIFAVADYCTGVERQGKSKRFFFSLSPTPNSPY
jgi:hypothetical protein